jgi:SAM-dependent methyltransferase
MELAGTFGGLRVLDYGCGDGTYLGLLAKSSSHPARAVGAEISESFIRSNRERFAGLPWLEFVHVSDLSQPGYEGAFDAVVCMEVLEHVLDPERYLAEFERLLAPGGVLLLSVPVEIGLSVVIKEAVRWINGWRGIGDYPGTTPYRWAELVRAVFAGSGQRVIRPVHRNPDGTEFHDHKGFNWRRLRDQVRERFELEAMRTSPLPWLPSFVASQVWFKARDRR